MCKVLVGDDEFYIGSLHPEFKRGGIDDYKSLSDEVAKFNFIVDHMNLLMHVRQVAGVSSVAFTEMFSLYKKINDYEKDHKRDHMYFCITKSDVDQEFTFVENSINIFVVNDEGWSSRRQLVGKIYDDKQHEEAIGRNMFAEYAEVEDMFTPAVWEDTKQHALANCLVCGFVHRVGDLRKEKDVSICSDCFQDLTPCVINRNNLCHPSLKRSDVQSDGLNPKRASIFECIEHEGQLYSLKSVRNSPEWCVCNHHNRYEPRSFFGDMTFVVGIGNACREGLEELIDQDEILECGTCGTYVRVCDSFRSRRGGRVCGNCQVEEDQVIKNYSYKPDPKFVNRNGVVSKEEYGDTLFLGCEIEIDDLDSREDAALAVMDAFDNVIYCKNDGSLGDDGVEFVTHPLESNYAVNSFDWETFESIIDDYNGHGEDGYHSCGMHVHINRSYLGECDTREINEAKLIMIYDKFYNNLVKFSRRGIDDAHEWASNTNCTFDGLRSESEIIEEKKKHGGRGAVNLNPRYTVEFRLWNSSSEPSVIRATLDMTQAIVRWCKNTTLNNVLQVKWDEFVRGVLDLALDRSNLESYLRRRGLYDN